MEGVGLCLRFDLLFTTGIVGEPPSDQHNSDSAILATDQADLHVLELDGNQGRVGTVSFGHSERDRGSVRSVVDLRDIRSYFVPRENGVLRG